VAFHEVLGEGFGTFELRSCGARPNTRNADLRESVRESRNEGSFGAYHHEVYGFSATERDECVEVVRRDGVCFDIACDACIRRCAEHPGYQWRSREMLREAVLARSRAHDENA
jgi:hypothetical protein